MLVHQAASEDDDEAANSPDEVCIHARARPSPAPALRPRRPPPCWPAPLVPMHVTLPTLPAPVHAERLVGPVLVHQEGLGGGRPAVAPANSQAEACSPMAVSAPTELEAGCACPSWRRRCLSPEARFR